MIIVIMLNGYESNFNNVTNFNDDNDDNSDNSNNKWPLLRQPRNLETIS